MKVNGNAGSDVGKNRYLMIVIALTIRLLCNLLLNKRFLQILKIKLPFSASLMNKKYDL